MQYSQEYLKTMVYAKFRGQTVYYGEFENREFKMLFKRIRRWTSTIDLTFIIEIESIVAKK